MTVRFFLAISCFVAATLPPRSAVAQGAFEIESVKAADPISNRIVDFRAYPGGRVVITNYTLRMIAAEAYRVSEYRVTGGPFWVSYELYNITAKPTAGSAAAAFMPPKGKAYAFPFPNLPGSPELLGMVQTLLADRFSLRIHHETHRLPVLALTVGKRSPRMAPSHAPIGDPAWRIGKEKNEWRNITIGTLIAIIEAHYRRPVLDRTGLTGIYDFHLSYDPEVRDTADGVEFPVDPTGTSLKMALEAQLGLMLEETKSAVETLVIDQAERPGAN